MNICVQVFAWMFLFLLDLYLGVDLLDHLVTNSVSNCLRSCQTVVPNGCTLRTASFQLSCHCPLLCCPQPHPGSFLCTGPFVFIDIYTWCNPGRIFLHPFPAQLSGVRGQR